MRLPHAIPLPTVFALVAGLVTLFAVASFATAQGGTEDNGFLSAPAPSSPPPATSDDLIEPEVTIIETDTEVIYEYRVNGRVYMVKIQPQVGPPYYMMDIDGDGLLDVQNQRPPELAVPQWLLFSW
ncbi:MAG: DUF2782 domain-containing protein [Thiohalocapsa sp.]